MPFADCFRCGRCNYEICENPKPETCKSGELRRNLCGCCQVCANAEGESCGGKAGACASGLECNDDGMFASRYGICRRKDDCQSIKHKVIENEDKLQRLISKASTVMKKLKKIRAKSAIVN